MRAQDLIVKGVGFVPFEVSHQNVKNFKANVIRYMRRRKDYFCEESFADIIGPDDFYELSFQQSFQEEPRNLKYKLKKFLGFSVSYDVYFHSLKRLKDSTPFIIRVRFRPVENDKQKGVLLEVISEPVLYHKASQSNEGYLRISDFRKSTVVYENQTFIKSLFSAFGAIIQKEPQTLSGESVSELYQTIDYYGFSGVSKLFISARKHLEKGNSRDALTDVREALRKVIVGLSKFQGQGLKSTTAFGRGFRKVVEKVNAPDHFKQMFSNTVGRLNGYLSNQPVHDRKNLPYDETRYILDWAELLCVYLIKKVKLGGVSDAT